MSKKLEEIRKRIAEKTNSESPVVKFLSALLKAGWGVDSDLSCCQSMGSFCVTKAGQSRVAQSVLSVVGNGVDGVIIELKVTEERSESCHKYLKEGVRCKLPESVDYFILFCEKLKRTENGQRNGDRSSF